MTPRKGSLTFAALLALAACKSKDDPRSSSTSGGVAAATGTGPGTAVTTAEEKKPFKAGIVFDVGGIDDKSFNEAAFRGLNRARDELGIEVQYYQPSQPADRKS